MAAKDALMKLFCYWLALAALSASAQTNGTNVPAVSTNAPAAMTNAPAAMTNVPAATRNVRPVSLRDCVLSALRHNFDVQIAQRTVNIARYNLKAAYGTEYDPTFSAGANRTKLDIPSNFDPKKNGVDNPYQETFETFDAGLSIPQLTPGLKANFSFSSTYDTALSFIGIPYPFIPNPPATGSYDGSYTTVPPYALRSVYNYEAAATLTLRQSLLKNFWIDAGRMSIQVNKKNLKISEQMLVLHMMQRVAAVEAAYYDLIYARDNVKVMAKALETSQKFLDDHRRLLAAGLATGLSEQLAQSQVETATANLAAAQEVLALRRNALRILITDSFIYSPDEVLEPTEVLTAVQQYPDRTESFLKALKMRPELMQAQLELERQGIIVRYDYNQKFPTLDLVGGIGSLAVAHDSREDTFDSLVDMEHPNASIGVVFSIPLGNVAARNRHKASLEAKEQAALNLKQVQQNIFVQVDDAIKSLPMIAQQVSATHQASVYAQATLEAEMTRFVNGLSTSFLIVEYERNLVMTQTREIQAKVNYYKALAQLAFSEGSILEKHQVNVEFK